MLQEDSEVELLVEKPVAGGRMLARHEGQIVLVAGAIPGERVRARVEDVGRSMAFASVVDILEPVDARRRPDGDPLCGGNVYAHIAYDTQVDIKREVLRDALRHGGRIEWERELPVAASPDRGYRMRARLHVRRGHAGFFREGTHDLCDAACSGQLQPQALDAVRQFIERTPRPWLDAIDALELAENIAADQRVLHVLWSQQAKPPRTMPPESWDVDQIAGLTGLSVDHPMSGRPRLISGSATVSDPLTMLIEVGLESRDACDARDAQLQRHAASFFQANRFLLPQLTSTVARWVDAVDGPSGPIIDLYAGVGLFAVTLAARAARAPEPDSQRQPTIVAIEGDPLSARDLKVNAQPFGARLQVEHTSVEQYLARATRHADATLIVDPPRTGMSRDALKGAIALRAARVLYVSCDVATFARDLRRLLDSGYCLDHLEAFDLFPNTAHVESLAVLNRQD
jgi:23S rRNA (uracil1939-C5)-methyltransferase